MGTIKRFVGFVAATGQLDINGREYLAEVNNPGAMLAIDRVLIIKDNNTSFTQEEINSITKELTAPLIQSADGNQP